MKDYFLFVTILHVCEAHSIIVVLLSDRSLNVKNVRKVMEEVKALTTVAQFGLSVSASVLDRIMRDHSNHGDRVSILAAYIVITLPNVTWETIAAKLYYWNETGAVEQAKMYIRRVTGEYVSMGCEICW